MKPYYLRRCCWLIGTLILSFSSFTLGQDALADEVFNMALSKLNSGSIQERGIAIEQLAAVKEPRAILILQALLEGRLFKLKTEDKLVIGEEIDAGYQLKDAKSGQDLGIVDREAAQKITLNNSLRVSLRKIIGSLELNANEAKVRVHAVQAMAKSIDTESLALLRDRLTVEQDKSVQDEIKLTLGMEQLNS